MSTDIGRYDILVYDIDTMAASFQEKYHEHQKFSKISVNSFSFSLLNIDSKVSSSIDQNVGPGGAF